MNIHDHAFTGLIMVTNTEKGIKHCEGVFKNGKNGNWIYWYYNG